MLIITKYLPATNNRGSRIKAKFACSNGSVSIPYSHELSGVKAHASAAQALLEKYNHPQTNFSVESLNSGYAFMGRTSYDKITLGV